jgi:hypothetical protein
VLFDVAAAPRSGKPKTYGADAGRRILALLDRPPPEGFARWTAPLIARELDDVSDQHVWRFLRAQGIDLAGRKAWCLSTDPEFAAKAADIVGLYLDPPENAVVLAVDEKPAIQALERAQGYLKLPNGRALTGFAHEYKRRGTTTLFAALEVATGQIKARHSKRRRRPEFLDFMNRLVAEYPDQEIHVVLDNLSTHKPKRDQRRVRHKNVHFHFTPTHASWLNQVRDLVLDPRPQRPQGRKLLLRPAVAPGHRRLHRGLQPNRHALPMAQGPGPSQRPRREDHGFMIASTSSGGRARDPDYNPGLPGPGRTCARVTRRDSATLLATVLGDSELLPETVPTPNLANQHHDGVRRRSIIVAGQRGRHLP